MFTIPSLTACSTSHSPPVPKLDAYQFRARMEVKDRIGEEWNSPIYDLDIHYDYLHKLSRYTYSTKGFQVPGDIIMGLFYDFVKANHLHRVYDSKIHLYPEIFPRI